MTEWKIFDEFFIMYVATVVQQILITRTINNNNTKVSAKLASYSFNKQSYT